MGVIAELVAFSRGVWAKFGEAPGKSAIALCEGIAGKTVRSEIYQSPGVLGIPPDGARGVRVQVGGSSRYGIVIATHNYAVDIDLGGAGGVAIYSTTSDGGTVKSKIVLSPDGKITITSDAAISVTSEAAIELSGTPIKLNGEAKTLVTGAELQAALTTLCTTINAALATKVSLPSTVTPVVACSIADAITTTVKTGG